MAKRLETYLRQRGHEIPEVEDRSGLTVPALRTQVEAAGIVLPKKARKAELLEALRERDLWAAVKLLTPRQQRRIRKRGLSFTQEA